MGQRFWFDVCNDYSLDSCEKPDLVGYVGFKTEVAGVPVTVYAHNSDSDEVHYLSCDLPDGGMLQDMYLE